MIVVHCTNRAYKTEEDLELLLNLLAEKDEAKWIKIGNYIFKISEIEAIEQTK